MRADLGTSESLHSGFRSEDLTALLTTWAPQQRWYPAKGSSARLELVGALALPAGGPEGAEDADEAVVVDHIVRLAPDETLDEPGRDGPQDGAPGGIVQIPLVYRRVPRSEPEAAAHLIGTLEGADGGWHVYDGPHDPAFTRSLLSLLAQATTATGLDLSGRLTTSTGSATGHRPPAGPAVPAPDSPARVLRGEQSNTSIIVEPADGPAVIVKVFRALHPGRNPDIEVQAALSAAGVSAVPALSAWVEGTWPTEGASSTSLVSGDLAVASEFLAGAQDAWREAVASVAAASDFSEGARALGAATARVHLAMAERLPSRGTTADDVVGIAEAATARAEWALASAPSLAGYAGALEAALASLRESLLGAQLPGLQRIHGDYHLGQVLHLPGRGWVLLDFEGEPLRPLAERTVPDLALRDVAGMLRSFDYAARQGSAQDDPGERTGDLDPSGWMSNAREAFLDGYAEQSGTDPRGFPELLDALELDKALYEVVYETRNRPDWVEVPLAAVDRLLSAHR